MFQAHPELVNWFLYGAIKKITPPQYEKDQNTACLQSPAQWKRKES
jgi:hypothetical protein